MKLNLYKPLFVILLLTLASAKIELSFLCAVVALAIAAEKKVSKPMGFVLLVFLALFVIGLLGLARQGNPVDVYIKDVVYFSRPVLVFLASYFLIKKIRDRQFLFTGVIVLGFAYSIIHILIVLANLADISSTTELRSYGGRYNHVEMIALLFILTSNSKKVKTIFSKLTFNLLVTLLIISFVLYFSRVMFVVLVLFLLAYKGYFRLTRKGFRLLFLGSILITCFVLAVNQFDVDSNSDGIKGFIFKIQNTYSEMFETLDIEKIKRDKRDLWKHWRGYEAQSALRTLNEEGPSSWIIGRGFGSTIDLGVEVKLANQNVRYVPLIHNGLVYVLFKTGILGLCIYLLLILYLYSFYSLKAKSYVQHNLNRLIVGCAFYVALSSLVITGVFKPYDLSGVILGALFALKYYYNDNRDFRH